MTLFATALLIAESYNGGADTFRSIVSLNMNQIGAIILIFIGAR